MPTRPVSDEELRRTLDALESVDGNIARACKLIGVAHTPFRNRLKRAQDRGILSTNGQIAVLHGVSPDPSHDLDKPIPAPLIIRGTSTLYDENGNRKLQWVKSKLDDHKVEEALHAAIAAMMESVPRVRKSSRPGKTIGDLLNLYTITDFHVGAYAWAAETGSDWDLKIAEETLRSGFTHMVANSPKARVALVNNLGDFLHFDSLSAITPTSGHLLDVDSRFSLVVKVGIRILRRVIDMALQHHEQVIVLMAEGNHDMASSVWLRHLFALLYENEPRIQVIESELPYYAYQHEEVMLGFHHGHLKKTDDLPLLFAAQYPEMWGATKKRYGHSGHKHHLMVREHSGMTWTQHPTIAARDAYAARGGWLADRRLIGYTYHSKFGETAQTTVNPEMFQAQSR